MPMLQMSGIIPPLPMYAFMTSIRTTLLFTGACHWSIFWSIRFQFFFPHACYMYQPCLVFWQVALWQTMTCNEVCLQRIFNLYVTALCTKLLTYVGRSVRTPTVRCTWPEDQGPSRSPSPLGTSACKNVDLFYFTVTVKVSVNTDDSLGFCRSG